MAEMDGQILLARWRFRAQYWNNLAESHRRAGLLQNWQDYQKISAVYEEVADEFEQALAGNYEPLERMQFRLASEMCSEEQERLRERYAMRNHGSTDGKKPSLDEMQVSEVIAKLAEDAAKQSKK